jgi:subtilase family serine protease
MRLVSRIAGIALAVTTATGGLALASPASATTSGTQTAAGTATQTQVCAAKAGSAHCTAIRATRTGISPNAATPSGLSPADLLSAYSLGAAAAANGSGQTIAIVDAFNDPTAEADLGVYRNFFGLSACTTANGCFSKVNQTGGTTYPPTDGGWAEEISLDLDMASAICPNCKILLVEATSASFANLGAAENFAAAHATVISNSYGGSDARDSTFGSFYNHPGVAITVSSGDSGFGVEYPASSHFVTAVGGTTLTKATGTARGWTESVWSGAGSGCSRLNTALTSAPSSLTGCSRRAVADVSAVADPNTGVSVYDSTAFQGFVGWLTFGGTSVSAPIIAGVYGLAGNAASINNNFPYTHASSFNDVTSGSNGSCSPAKLCTAGTGWDGPTGVGTPNGTGGL